MPTKCWRYGSPRHRPKRDRSAARPRERDDDAILVRGSFTDGEAASSGNALHLIRKIRIYTQLAGRGCGDLETETDPGEEDMRGGYFHSVETMGFSSWQILIEEFLLNR
ncbi:hypothetical protein ACMFMG_011274 [Clarireedia jacksonii]